MESLTPVHLVLLLIRVFVLFSPHNCVVALSLKPLNYYRRQISTAQCTPAKSLHLDTVFVACSGSGLSMAEAAWQHHVVEFDTVYRITKLVMSFICKNHRSLKP